VAEDQQVVQALAPDNPGPKDLAMEDAELVAEGEDLGPEPDLRPVAGEQCVQDEAEGGFRRGNER